MSFLDEVETAAADLPIGGKCTVGSKRATWSTAFQAEFDAALQSPNPSTVIARVLRDKRGIDIPAQTLQRHRKGMCRCGSTR